MHLWLSSYAKEKLTLRNPTLTTLKPHNCGFFYPLAVQLLKQNGIFIIRFALTIGMFICSLILQNQSSRQDAHEVAAGGIRNTG
jgi:hypothetical protein